MLIVSKFGVGLPTPALEVEGSSLHIHTEPARKVTGALKMVLALLAALAIAISTIVLIDPAPAHAQETEATSEESAADTPSDATRDAAEQAVSEEPATQPSVVEEAPEPEVVEEETQPSSEAPSEEAKPEEEEKPSEEERPEEDDPEALYFDSEPHNGIMAELAGQNRRRSARAVQPSNDPRYTCGASVALILDTSSSTKPFQQNAKNAANRAIDNLVGTGSQLGIISFDRTARPVLQKN